MSCFYRFQESKKKDIIPESVNDGEILSGLVIKVIWVNPQIKKKHPGIGVNSMGAGVLF